jgi:hypothetical protein
VRPITAAERARASSMRLFILRWRGSGEAHTGRDERARKCGSREGQGTGSCPPGRNGWHLAIRFAANHDPRTTPWRSIASTAYAEQVGV